ncbi:MAG: hypothetical protein K1X88_25535, partial [Nannocystaceae bacterium]|nr:hypothetical protein [Nannocystaceae bacterium]
MRPRLAPLCPLVLGLACGGASPPPSPERGPDAAPARKAADALLAEGEAESVQAALQGTFAMPWWRGDGERHPEVWSIAGEQLTRWDGTSTEVATLRVIAPCLARIDWPSGSFTYQEFVLDGDRVWFGTSGGPAQADRTVACSSLGVWVLGPDGCKRWAPGGFSSNASGLSAHDATCALAANGDFTADGNTWVKQGDVRFERAFTTRKQTPPVRHASLAA